MPHALGAIDGCYPDAGSLRQAWISSHSLPLPLDQRILGNDVPRLQGSSLLPVMDTQDFSREGNTSVPL